MVSINSKVSEQDETSMECNRNLRSGSSSYVKRRVLLMLRVLKVETCMKLCLPCLHIYRTLIVRTILRT